MSSAQQQWLFSSRVSIWPLNWKGIIFGLCQTVMKMQWGGTKRYSFSQKHENSHSNRVRHQSLINYLISRFIYSAFCSDWNSSWHWRVGKDLSHRHIHTLCLLRSLSFLSRLTLGFVQSSQQRKKTWKISLFTCHNLFFFPSTSYLPVLWVSNPLCTPPRTKKLNSLLLCASLFLWELPIKLF